MNERGQEKQRIWRGPVLAWVALIMLFLANLGSAYLPLGAGNLVANLIIAAVMAGVLMVVLMDLQSAQVLVRVIAVAGLFWTTLMFVLTFTDYLSR
jgi:cytochrome c oxidase subunit IV